MDKRIALSPREAADALSIGKTRLYELVARQEIEARRCGGRTLILVDSLLAYVRRLPSLSHAAENADTSTGIAKK